MDRRIFMGSLALSSAGLALSPGSLSAFDAVGGNAKGGQFDQLTKRLLVDWCDGMIRRQINQPDNLALHGALGCPSCEHIHGRCSDAMYPFMHMASVTGDKKYLQAAIDVFEWANRNVTNDDGSWRNDIRPKAWRGTTIFGAIALAESLHYHGKLLDEEQRKAWMERLDRAVGGYLYKDFKTIDFTNLNYGMTAVYGFHLFGKTLNNQKYTDRGLQFAKRVKEFFTDPNTLLWGEGKPNNNRSGRGLLPVDLGYNVEESLNGVALYALEVNDTEMLELVTKAMSGHLEFMLPDGAWDNSWGTRSQKWSYWGSRTSDGCQPAFSLMAGHNPAFATAALKNAELLQRCTSDGLLHGGPHYVSHGVNPCIHHTFAHAKVMALVQDKLHSMPKVEKLAPLPREAAMGVKHFPELDVWLVAKGPWRGTVSAYDSIYKTKKVDHLQQPTGGSLAVLYHNKVGTLLAGSMARYIMVEPLNMQPQPGEDFPLTTRVETRKDSAWYTNLYDLKAEVTYQEKDPQIVFDVKTTLQDGDRNIVPVDPAAYAIRYQFDNDKVTIGAQASDKVLRRSPAMLVVPILSPTGEAVRQVSETHIEIDKPDGTVVVKSNAPLSIKETGKGRVFNMVPTRPFSGWNYITTKGRGVYVADTLTIMNPQPKWWGEGDAKCWVDGEDFPALFGTGTEDYYAYSWGGVSTDFHEHPFHAQPFSFRYNKLNRKQNTGERDTRGFSTESRSRALDTIPFGESMQLDMEVWSGTDCDMGYQVGMMWYGFADTTSNRKPQPQEVLNVPPLPDMSEKAKDKKKKNAKSKR